MQKVFYLLFRVGPEKFLQPEIIYLFKPYLDMVVFLVVFYVSCWVVWVQVMIAWIQLTAEYLCSRIYLLFLVSECFFYFYYPIIVQLVMQSGIKKGMNQIRFSGSERSH